MIKVIYNKTCGRCVQSEPLTSGMVGQPIHFEYSHDFDGLAVTAVFTDGKNTVDVVNPGSECIIPHEVLTTVGAIVKVGIYAVKGDELVIPTVYATIGVVQKGADPSGDVSADQTLPVWAQIQALIGNLNDLSTEAKNNLVAAINEAAQTGGGGGGSTVELDTTLTQSGKAADAKAVGDALAGKQNTISDLEAIRTGAAKGATALQSVPSTYRTASEQDTIDDGKVDKVTGKGLSSNDYTDAAKAKVDALAPVATSGSYNDLTNKPTIPTALPNPHALTFTGAVTGSYDGSAPLSVEIPSGGGNKGWTLLYDGTITIEEAVKTVTVSLLVPCDGMVDFVGHIKWTANANTENANDNISIWVGKANMGYGRIGDASNTGNAVFQATVTSSRTYFGRAFHGLSLEDNSSNMQYCFGKNVSNPDYENVIIDFFAKTYAGTITLQLYGR